MTPSAERKYRAHALTCASIVWKGNPSDMEGLLSVADEYYQYIVGDDSAAIPRPDKRIAGKLPKR